MRRRRFLASVGTLASAGGVALGTGAFTSVSATRSVSVRAADDAYAFLRLSPLRDEGMGDGSSATGRSFTNGETVKFEVPGDEPGENGAADGVGLDSVYEFHDLLRIENHGTQPVEVFSEYDGRSLDDLALVQDGTVLRDDPPTIDVGDGVNVGLFIDTPETGVGEFDETLTIVAERVGDNRD